MTPEQAAQKYHWVKYDSSTNTIELFLDHHSLSWSRSCEAGFVLEHLLHIRPNYGKMPLTEVDILTGERKQKYISDGTFIPIDEVTGIAGETVEILKPIYVEKRKPWFLDFGEYMHYMFELFYKSFIHLEKNYTFDYLLKSDQQCLNLQDFLEIARKVWDLMDMDYYKDHGTKSDMDRYEELGAFPGCVLLLTEYYVYYMDLRIRVVDTEIIFGYDREVPIGEFLCPINIDGCHGDSYIEFKVDNLLKVKCYLTGRIDLLTDNGYKIGPRDHKNSRYFDGDESEDYNPQDAITGYIYATRCILQKNYPKYFDKGQECLTGWIQHISAKEPSVNRKTKIKGPRFKVTTIDKTPSQLEAFKERQLSTFKRICELLFNNKTPEWNTSICNNVYGRPCQFKEIHRQSSEEWEHIIKDHFKTGEAWDPKLRDSDKIDAILREKKILKTL